MSLVRELKRRNVLRAAAAYVAVAWLLIQVAETILPAFGLSGDATRTVVILLAIGFIPVVILSWTFELTPEGLRRDGEVDRNAPALKAMGKRMDRAVIVVLVLAVAYFAVDKFVFDPARDVVRERAAQERGRSEAFVESYGDNSIVVLPFANMSSDPEQEYFSDGIAEELLDLLARIPELRVVSRQTAFSLKDEDLEASEIAERLNVKHVLDGSVRRSGDNVRISARLVDGRSDTQLWSKTYNRPIGDVFSIQDEISADVAENLQVALTGSMPAISRSDTRAYDHYLRGRHIWHRRGNVDLQAAIDNFAEAVRIDPDFAKGWAALASAYVTYPSYSSKGFSTWRLAEDAAAKALQLDPELAEPYAILAIFAEDRGEWIDAESNYLYALSRDDNRATTHYWYGEFLAKVGKYAESVRHMRRATDLDPTYMPPQMDLAFHAVNFRDYARAAVKFQDLWDKGFQSPECWMGNLISNVMAGNYDAAHSWIDRATFPDPVKQVLRDLIAVESGTATDNARIAATIMDPEGVHMNYLMAVWVTSRLGSYDDAFQVIKSRLDRQLSIETRLLWGPVGDLREQAQFAEVLERLGLLDYWQSQGWGEVCRLLQDRLDCAAADLTPEHYSDLIIGDRA